MAFYLNAPQDSLFFDKHLGMDAIYSPAGYSDLHVAILQNEAIFIKSDKS